MDIILAIAPRILDDFGYTPAGPALLKGNLQKHGYSCKILDFNADIDKKITSREVNTAVSNFFLYYNFYNEKTWNTVSNLIDEWAQQIVKENPKWLGISIFSYNSHRAARLLAIRVKYHDPKIKIVIGGAGIYTDKKFPEALLKANIVDAFIRGEGEIALVELLKGNRNYPGINGIAPVQIDDVDAIPFPEYDDYELQTYTNQKGLVALPITGSRGCVRRCSFCDIHNMWPSYRYRSGGSIADEIKYQVEKYGVKAFRFTDSLINGSMKAFRDMTIELAEYRKKMKPDKRFYWDSHFIIRSEKQMPEQDFKLMAESGAGTMLIGVESGSQSVRDHMAKKFTQEHLDYTLLMFEKYKIKCRFLMIIGYPTETQQDFQDTLDMFTRYKHLNDKGIIEEVNLGLTLNLLPGTPLHTNREKDNIVQLNDHINDWICKDNPELNYKERLRRRIKVQAHCMELGYKIFNEQIDTKTLFSAWQEVTSFDSNTLVIKDFKYDREKGGLVINNPSGLIPENKHRTY